MTGSSVMAASVAPRGAGCHRRPREASGVALRRTTTRGPRGLPFRAMSPALRPTRCRRLLALAVAAMLELQLVLADEPGATAVERRRRRWRSRCRSRGGAGRRSRSCSDLAVGAALAQGLLGGGLYSGRAAAGRRARRGRRRVLLARRPRARAPRGDRARSPASPGCGRRVVASGDADVQSFLFSGGLVGLAPWLAGRATRARRAAPAALEREREQRARAAASEERQRIARELHDVVAHGVVLMVLQAQGARRILDHDPERARERARGDRGDGSDGARRDARARSGCCATTARAAELQPQPTLGDLGRRWSARCARRGCGVDLRVRGAARELRRRRRPLRLPDRPGGAHEHDQARRAGADARDRQLRARRLVLEIADEGRGRRRGRRRRRAGARRDARARAPARRRARRAARRRPRLRRAGADPAGGMSIRVLLVDDHALVRDRLPHGARRRARHRGRRRGGHRPPGGAQRAAARARRRADGRPHARARRDRGDARDRRRGRRAARARSSRRSTSTSTSTTRSPPGASGFLLKDVGPEQLVDGDPRRRRRRRAARADGDAAADRRAGRARGRRAPAPPEALDELTPRELEVLAARRAGALQRRDRRAARRRGDDGQDPRLAAARQARPARPRRRRSCSPTSPGSCLVPSEEHATL